MEGRLKYHSTIWSKSSPLRDTSLQILSDLNLTLQCDSRSNLMVPLDSKYTILYYCSMIAYILPSLAPFRRTHPQRLSDLDFDFQDH